jgi:hypothetical protein
MELSKTQSYRRILFLTQVLLIILIFTGCEDDIHNDSICTHGNGLIRQSQTCSIHEICNDLVPSYAIYDSTLTYINTASDEPICGTSALGISLGRPYYYDGSARNWVDDDGVERYWCESRPVGTSSTSPRPLVIWVTGSGGGAGSVFDKTSLRNKQQRFDLSGNPERPGFILVSIQPRNLHWPTDQSHDGTRSETYYRDLNTPSTNSDIAFMDHIIDTLVAEGVVDRDRIYMMGWSNGARFTSLYSITRHELPTPDGNYVAAVANYSGGDPYASFDYTKPECSLSNLPRSSIPYFMISRQCDLVACNDQTDLKVVPGNVVEPWMGSLRDEIGAEVSWLKINILGNPVTSCADADHCTKSAALYGHLQWPDGLDDMGGIDHEPTMLQFLANHRLR